MTFTIGGERRAQTLGLVLTSPARRVPLFLGRAMPVILNGWGTAMIGIVSGVWRVGGRPAGVDGGGRSLPLTHAIEATRAVADGAAWSAVSGLVATELLIGAAYVVLGLLALHWLEHLSRTHATLEQI